MKRIPAVPIHDHFTKVTGPDMPTLGIACWTSWSVRHARCSVERKAGKIMKRLMMISSML